MTLELDRERTMRAAFLVAALLLTSSTAFAQEPEETTAEDDVEDTGEGETQAAEEVEAPPDTPEIREARRHYEQGAVFFRQERYEQAISEFTEAYALWDNPLILYSLGQANERLLRVTRAISFYERFLRAAPDDPRTAEVEDTVRGLRMLLATVVVESNVPATVHVDGQELGEAPGEFELSTGTYTVELRAEGFEPASQSVQLAARTSRTLSFELEEVPEASTTIEQTTIVEGREGLSRVWFWTGLGVTGAAVITASILGGVTLQKASDYEADPMRTKTAQDQGNRLALMTDVAIGASVLFAVGTLLLYLNTDWGADEEDAAAVSAEAAILPGGGFIGVRGRL